MKLLILFALCACGISCTSTKPMFGARNPDDHFHQLSDSYITGYLDARPEAGVGLGLHEYDGKTSDYSANAIHAEHTRLREFLQRFEAIDPNSLSPELAIERRALLAAIHDELFSYERQKSFFRNPMTYSSAFDLTTYAKRDFAPKAERMKSVIKILAQVPDTMKLAHENLQTHLAKTFITTAIEESNGAADFFTGDLLQAFDDVKDTGLQSQLKNNAKTAADHMRAYAKWLEKERLPQASDDFAIGRDNYVRMLHDGELLNESPEQILEVGLRELKREQDRFAAAAKIIDPNHSATEVYKAIQQDHPTEKSLIPDAIKHLDQIRQFVIDRKIVGVPSDVRVKVEETPRFERATSFASMDSPGPFEAKADEAFYYITPTEPDWDAKHKGEWLTAFNYYATDVTTIHEAYPGHYVQHLHLKASNASRIDKIFGSYAFIEGWAHYCEQMLIDEGFPARADKITAAKYRLEQSDEALLRLCRLCCSIKMHCQKMSVDDATKFFMDNCYYEESPARSEAERGTYDPGYAFYTLGKLQILKLRDDYQKQEGKNFSLRKFHDALLDHGQPPVRLLREVLLKDSATWNAALPEN